MLWEKKSLWGGHAIKIPTYSSWDYIVILALPADIVWLEKYIFERRYVIRSSYADSLLATLFIPSYNDFRLHGFAEAAYIPSLLLIM